MRFLRPLIFLVCISVAALGTQREVDSRRSSDRVPASISPPAVEKAVEEKAPAKEAETSANGDSLWPQVGERWIYRFERKASADYAGKPWLKLAIGGRAAIESGESAGFVASGGDRFYLLSIEVDRLEMQGEKRNETRTFPSVRLELDRSGKLRELRFVARPNGVEISEEEADLVRDLTAQWLFFENRSRLGSAEIEWSTAGAPGPIARQRTVSKRVLRYSGRPEISKLDSVHEWVTGAGVDAGLKVDRIDGVENFTLGSPNGDFTQATSYRWVWTSTERVTNLGTQTIGASFTIEESPLAQSGGGTEKKVDSSAIALAWAKMKDLIPHERLRLFRDAKRALDGGASELVSLVLRDLKGKTSTSIEWRTGVGVLAATSNPEAAQALLALYREPGRSTDEKLSILSGVAAGEGSPAPEWKEAFESALERAPANPITSNSTSREFDPDAAVREASLYALGSSIRKETDASRRQNLEAVLWREVKEARTENAQTTVLEAIGNSGSGDYYAYVQDQFAAGTARVREKAVAAVRFFASDLAKPIIDRAKADPVSSVRKVAEWSAKFQDAASSNSAE